MRSLTLIFSVGLTPLLLIGCASQKTPDCFYTKEGCTHYRAVQDIEAQPCSVGHRHCNGVVQRHKHIERWKPNTKVPQYVPPTRGYACQSNCLRRGADTRFSHSEIYGNGYEDGCRTAWTGGRYKNPKLMANSYPYQIGWEAGFNQCRYDRSHANYGDEPRFSYIPY